jgi:RNA polymerase sigma-70 factor (ECF subfamily)
LGTGDTSLVALVDNAIKGDEAAYKELYNMFANTMFNICIRMTGNRQEAEDILQDSLITAFEKLSQLKDKRMFGGWLRKIVVTNCIRYTKTKTGLEKLAVHNDEIDEDDDGFTQINAAALHDAIKNLPEGCRQIFLLYTSEDYTHKQIGVLLNISESTSKSQYLRAKKLLKEKLVAENA